MTKKFILIFTLFGLTTLSNISAQNKAETPCEKCGKGWIVIMAEHYDKVSIAEVEKFFCSLDKKCDLKEAYDSKGATFGQIAFEMFVVELDLHLDECVAFIEKNKDIDFNYLLTLLLDVEGHDLPYPSIIAKLEKKKSLNTIEQKILDAIKKSKANYKKKHPTK